MNSVLKQQDEKTYLTSCHCGTKLRTDEVEAEMNEEMRAHRCAYKLMKQHG